MEQLRSRTWPSRCASWRPAAGLLLGCRHPPPPHSTVHHETAGSSINLLQYYCNPLRWVPYKQSQPGWSRGALELTNGGAATDTGLASASTKHRGLFRSHFTIAPIHHYSPNETEANQPATIRCSDRPDRRSPEEGRTSTVVLAERHMFSPNPNTENSTFSTVH
jgi:hypothetical protein